MNTANSGFGLWIGNERTVSVPLRGVEVDTEIAGPLACTRIAQTYKNDRRVPIEAIYAFPLPLNATLLGLEIEIGGQKIAGRVQAKKQAEDRYEKAVVEGDGAFLLRQLNEGQYQMALGNLKPGEACRIELRYAEFLPAVGQRLRYRLPTVIAPKYGDSTDAGIDPTEATTTDLLAEYPLHGRITLKGDFARGEIESPTHPLIIERGGAVTTVTLAKGAFLDRDWVVALERNAPAPLEVWSAPDGEQHALLAHVHLPNDSDQKSAARRLAVLVDCSGSMNGSSMAQVRKALRSILELLTECDTLTLVRFGSKVDVLTPEPVAVTEQARKELFKLASRMEADLGGTEILQGLNATLKVATSGADILLITDGGADVADDELRAIAQAGHRIFTVGVGTAVAEKLVRRLAEHSGGACELVTPNEEMEIVIVNQFLRMARPAVPLSIDWGSANEWCTPSPSAYIGESSSLLALAKTLPDNRQRVVGMTTQEDETCFVTQTTAIPATDLLAEALPRMLAQRRLAGLTAEEALALALRYQLMTGQTAMVAVHVRVDGEKVEDLPERIDVPQMMAAGWGGTGPVCGVSTGGASQGVGGLCFLRMSPSRAIPGAVEQPSDRYEIPAFLRRHEPSDAAPETHAESGKNASFVQRLVDGIKKALPGSAAPVTTARLTRSQPPLLLALYFQREWADNGRIPTMTWREFVDRFGASLPESLCLSLAKSCPVADDAPESFALVLAFLDALVGAMDAIAKRRLRPLHRALVATLSQVPAYTQHQDETNALLKTVSNARWGIYESTPARPARLYAE